MARDYELAGGWGWAAVAAVWTWACAAVLEAANRLAGCGAATLVDGLTALGSAPGECSPVPLAGEAVALHTGAPTGAPFGIGGTLEPAMAQVLALGALAFATVATILVVRWKHRASSDPSALALVWAGAVAMSIPRLFAWSAATEIHVAGIPTSIGELAFVWGATWLGLRVLGEAIRR